MPYSVLAAVALLVSVSSGPPAATAESSTGNSAGDSAAEIVARHIAARGGIDKLEAIETLRIVGTMDSIDEKTNVSWEWKAPRSVRMESTRYGLLEVQATDGETAWEIVEWKGRPVPAPMTETEGNAFAAQADFLGPLIHHREKGIEIEYVGLREIEGQRAHELLMIKSSGERVRYFLDEETMLETMQRTTILVSGFERTMDIHYLGHQEIDGVMFPTATEVRESGGPRQRLLTFDSVEVNPEIPDSRFEMSPHASE